MNDSKYSFNIKYSSEDEGFIATCPEFPGLSAFGETEEEAVIEARIALGGFIESYIEAGRTLPEPNQVREFSGQLRLRLTKSLHRSLSVRAESEGVSLNTLLIQCIQEGLTKKTISDELREFINKGFARTERIIERASETEISITEDIGDTIISNDLYRIQLGVKNETKVWEA